MHADQTDEVTRDLGHDLSHAIKTKDLAHLYLVWTRCRDGTRQPSDYDPNISLEQLQGYAQEFLAQLYAS